MPERWTDDRLDDLRDRVETGLESNSTELRAFRIESRTEFVALRGEMKAGFAEVDQEFSTVRKEFAVVRQEMKAGFAEVDQKLARIDKRFEQVDERFEVMAGKFEELNRTVIAACLSLILALFLYGVFLD